jgi:hypothetical protein
MALSSFLVMRHQRKSARFHVGGCRTPYPGHYNPALAFSPSFTRTALGFPYGRLSSCEERYGLTTFHYNDRIGLGSLCSPTAWRCYSLAHDPGSSNLCARCIAVLATARKHLRPLLNNDVYRGFTFVSHAVHPCPSPPDAGRYVLSSRSGCPLSRWDTLSEGFRRFVALPPYLLGYG